MGPTILLDKSALQALNQVEIRFLYRHFSVMIPDILVREIVADLTKAPGESEYSVQKMIGKIQPLGNYLNAPYKDICISNLYGHRYPMDGRIVMMGGEEVIAEDGSKGIVYGHDPRWDIMRKWGTGFFSDEDVKFSLEWRESIKNLDWERLVKLAKIGRTTRARNLFELHIETLNINVTGGIKKQLRHLNYFMEYLEIPIKNQNEIADKFLDSEHEKFFKYARYAYFCFSISQTFAIGMFNGLVPTRNSGILDLEYLFYLPFCQVFVTNDNFQYEYASAVKGPFHTVIRGTELKSALSGLCARYKDLSDEERRQYEYDFGSYPPLEDKSIVSDIWKRYCKPWKPKSGNTAEDLSPEQSKKIIAHIMAKMKPARKIQSPPP